MICHTTDVSLTKTVREEMAGMSVCVGYLCDYLGHRHSPPFLLFCPAIRVESENMDKVGLGGPIDYAEMKFCDNRSLISEFKISPEDALLEQFVSSLASTAWLYQAVQRVFLLPPSL